ncbi:MAG TPA: hypothetical protein VHC21_01350 [Candidatus Saccharimonadales bacterium]|nr:hypothetical protein [Candidatus Saccharimonadales bacterium]
MFRKSSPERAIAKLTSEVRLHEGNRISWTIYEPYLARCALKLAIDPATATPYYELNTARRAAPPADAMLRASRFMYLPNGEILGVLRSEVDPLHDNGREVEEAIDFQVENGLVVPNAEDKQELIDLLEARIS